VPGCTANQETGCRVVPPATGPYRDIPANDDVPAATVAHDAGGVLPREEDALADNVIDVVPLFLGEFLKPDGAGPGSRLAGIGEQNVEPAEGGQRLIERAR
jgi:hypothetical protein